MNSRIQICSAIALCLGMTVGASALPEPVTEWTLKVEGIGAPSPVAYPNENPNGVVVGLGGRVAKISGEGKLLFDKSFGPDHNRGDVFYPTIADLDGDGVDEIVAGHNAGFIYALDGMTGETLWEFNLGTGLATWRMASAADLDGDGKLEVVATNMAGWVYCLEHDGKFRWRSKVEEYRLSTPAIGDIDNDGELEIVYGSATRHLIALDKDGRIEWDRFQPPLHMGRTFPLIADLDEDGDAEVYTLSSMIGRDTGVLSLNGKDGSVRWTAATWHKAYCGMSTVNFSDGTRGLLVSDKGNNVAAYRPDGTERWHVEVNGRGIWCPQVVGDIDGDGKNEIVVTVRGVSNDGKGNCWYVLDADTGEQLGGYPGSGAFGSALIADIDGDGGLEVVVATDDGTLSAFDFGGPAKEGAVVSGSWRGVDYVASRTEEEVPHSDSRMIRESAPPKFYGVAPVEFDEGRIKSLVMDLIRRAGDKTVLLRQAKLASVDLGLKNAGLISRIENASDLDVIEQDELARDVKEFLAEMDRTKEVFSLLESELEADRVPKFALWQDANPWDNLDPLDTIPTEAGDLTFDTWAFGNETESVCVNLLNLDTRGITLRVEPGAVRKSGDEKTLRPASEITTLHRPVWIPSRFGEVVPDVLPELGEAYLLDIAPGEVRQLWINLSTKDLEVGNYEIAWPIRTLEENSVRKTLTVNLEVSPFRLPKKSRYLANFWARNQFGEIASAPDLSEHLQTIWYQLPLPAAKADANGEIIGELDWTAHDKILDEAEQVELILYGSPRVPSFPEGVEVTDELRLEGSRSYAKLMMAHHREHGLDYENFMFYVEDETGLRGDGIEHYMKRARANKEIDPNFQNYANPWGSITKEQIEEMWEVTDVWQPGMETIEFLGPEYVDAMRPGGKRIATYTPPGNQRILRPLGFFRAQAWKALHWGIEGGGWWVYQGTDLFGTPPEYEPDYGAVNYDGRTVVGSRRWEANRDGIEDFNAVVALRDLAEEKGDAAALKVIDEAVAAVAARTITGMPREAADYELDFEEFSEHRKRIKEALERLTK